MEGGLLVRIRAAEITDRQAVYALLCALENRALPEAAFAETYARNLNEPLIRYLVAEEGGAVRGFVSLHMDRQLHHAALVGEIQELIVAEAWRSRGVGGALLRAAQREARATGCAHLQLSSGFARTRAHAFYERNGWAKDHFSFTYTQLQEDA